MKRINIILIVLFTLCETISAQVTKENTLVKATADSSNFIINLKSGWQQYGSAVRAINSDSILVETIIQHSKIDIDWTQEQLIGQIKLSKMRPLDTRLFSFNLISSIYKIRVEPNGKCYLWLDYGELPEGDLVILPLKIVYHK